MLLQVELHSSYLVTHAIHQEGIREENGPLVQREARDDGMIVFRSRDAQLYLVGSLDQVHDSSYEQFQQPVCCCGNGFAFELH